VLLSLVQTIGPRAGAADIASAIERRVADGTLAPGTRLPAVRELASALAVSPATVAAAYRTLSGRGFAVADRRRGTSVAPAPPVRISRSALLPPGVRDLAGGNPDPALLPPLAPALARIDPQPLLYGGPARLPELEAHAEADFAADGIHGDLAVTGGALDAIERALETELRPGDAVGVEDPTWPRIVDLVRALGLVVHPVAVDRDGLDPDALDRALRLGARAVIVTPRGQNPTGATIGRERADALQEVLARHPEVLAIEDDYLAGIAGAPYNPVHDPDGRWLVVRSLSKVVGPDLRLALVAGDALTISRVEGRQRLGPGWASHILQQLAAVILGDPATPELLDRAERVYATRREALVAALAARGIDSSGDTGLGVWVPLVDEAVVVADLLLAGWAVGPGERFRLRSAPAIRITTTDLEPSEADVLAATLARLRDASDTTYTA
jgi:DNA-binding transcriptional MocR family regulator